MGNFFKKYWFITAVIFFASFLRLYRLDVYPAFNADEASIGYDAYSLLKTGMDQHGNSWPVHYQSFNDYKPGLYVYLVLPFVKFLGLNEWAVRIPGAVSGVLTVLVLYFLVKELFPDRRKFTIAEIAALFLAISPWHIQFSRGGWEVNVSTFLITVGVLMFLRALKKPGFLAFTLSLLPVALSLYTYHAARIIAPLLALGIGIIFRKKIFIKQNIKLIAVSISLFIILLTPLARKFIKGDVLSRAAGVGLFADPGPINRINEQRGEHRTPTEIGAKILHNKAVNYGLAFLENWSAHYHGLFLFVSGDNIERDKVPETGQMYMTDIVFVLLGLIFLIKNKNNEGAQLIGYWLIIAPIAAALTFQSPHALRSQNMVIPLVITAAIGFTELIHWCNNKNLRFGIWLMIILVVWSFARYEHMYWVHMAKEYPFSSQYGVKELVDYVKENQNNYQNIIISNRYDQPYILFLFYMQYPPEKFQFHHALSSRDDFGFSTVKEFGKFSFITFRNWEEVKKDYVGSLIAGTPEEIPSSANVIKRIKGTNGYEYFDIVAN